MDEVDKILSDAVNDRNRWAWEAREGREACVAVHKQNDLEWVVYVLADLRRDNLIVDKEFAALVASARGWTP